MIRNLTYRNKDLKEELDDLLGKEYSIWDAIKRGSTGSPRMEIIEASKGFEKLLSHGTGRKFCNIELRPKGIILRFRYQLETMGFMVPFHQMSVFQNGSEYSVHSGGEFLKVRPIANQGPVVKFFAKILSRRLDFQNQLGEFQIK